MKKIFFILIFFSCNAIAQEPFAVVELFTSEGCLSCPPADGVLSKISADAEKNKKNIFFLEYHVDYWNKGGWKDPFSKNLFTMRQENYSRVLPEKEMYTPEIVINGMISFIGSDEKKTNENISRALNETPKLNLESGIDSVKNDTVYINYKLSASNPNYVIRCALTENDLSSSVTSGENKGKVLHHDHVVTSFVTRDNPGTSGQIKIPLKGKKLTEKNRLVVFVQHKQTMKIVAAGKVK
jgi:hypothetical protein